SLMLIYIVEDSALKAGKIQSFLTQKFTDLHKSEVFSSYQSGLRAIQNRAPDILLLDMTLPNFDRAIHSREGRVRPLGGYDLMRKLQLKELICKVIVVTQLESFGEGDEEISFDEITSRCSIEFPNLFIDSVYFDQSGVKWQIKL